MARAGYLAGGKHRCGIRRAEGKTHVVADLAMHAAHGMHWHGYAIARPLSVAYLAGEGRNGLRVRLHAWCRRHHGVQLRGDLRVLLEAVPIASRVTEMLDALRDCRPNLINVDTLNAYFGSSDENSSQDMTAFVAAVRHLRDELACAVVIVHHTGLADATRERGSSVLRAAADVIAQVARDEGGSGLIGLQVVGARDMEPWAAPLSLRLVPAETDWADDEGQPIGTCLITAGDVPVSLPGRGGRPLGHAQNTVLAVARELARAKANGHDEVTLARHDVSRIAHEQHGLSRQSISSAWQPLHERGLLHLVEPGSVRIRCLR